MRWTLLVDAPLPGWHNMAVDSALLDWAEAEAVGFLRLYRWQPFCLSFGRHEPAARRYDRARIRTLGLDCVRRPTGGRAVWHARELTYAVIAPITCFSGLRPAYRRIHEILGAALRALGAAPVLAAAPGAGPGPATPGPCFSAPVGGELLIDQRKVVGSAQLRQGNAFLQHGSLLLEDDQSLPRELAGQPSDESAEAPLSRLLGRVIGFAEAAQAVRRAADAALGPMEQAGAVPRSLEPRVRLHAERFRDPAWTWQR